MLPKIRSVKGNLNSIFRLLKNIFNYSSISLNLLEITFHLLVCLDLSISHNVYAITMLLGLILCAINSQGFHNDLKCTKGIFFSLALHCSKKKEGENSENVSLLDPGV